MNYSSTTLGDGSVSNNAGFVSQETKLHETNINFKLVSSYNVCLVLLVHFLVLKFLLRIKVCSLLKLG